MFKSKWRKFNNLLMNDTTKTTNNFKIATVIGDVRESEVLVRIVDTAIQRFGKINVLVWVYYFSLILSFNFLIYLQINNAGTTNGFENIENISMKSFDEIMNINVRAVVELTHYCIKHLIETKGVIVNMSSVAGTNSYPNMLPYQISKSALDQFTKCISLEVGSKGVRVNSIK
jgi:NAD(P)-dependent dehydrogenase (short-subunit alcohol dehydrogenase family)